MKPLMKPLAGSMFFKSSLFDFQLMRSIHHFRYGGPDFGQCFEICRNVVPGDWESWHTEWLKAADWNRTEAEKLQSSGNAPSARRMWRRAVECYRNATYALLSNINDPRLITGVATMKDCFCKAGGFPGGGAMRELKIPYENTTLPGYYFQPPGPEKPRPTILINTGYTCFCEESYFLCGAAALERGYNIFLYDGPGQGSALVNQKLYFRPDWEKVLTPLVDHALTLPGVDPKQIVVFGCSFDGLLSARGLAYEPRIAAAILDPAEHSKYLDVLHTFTPAAVAAFETGDETLVNAELEIKMQDSDTRFFWHCRMQAHNSLTPLDYLHELKRYDLGKSPMQIRCPTAVSCAENDDRGTAQVKEVFEMLTCPKKFFSFYAAQGAGEHCQVAAPEWTYQTFYDWLDDTLAKK